MGVEIAKAFLFIYWQRDGVRGDVFEHILHTVPG